MNKTIHQFEKTVDEIFHLQQQDNTKLNEPIHEGKWSIREIVGHLYYWDKFNLEKMVPLMSNGANLPPFPDHDSHNEEAITYLKDHSVEMIIDEFIQTRKSLIKVLSQLDADVKFTIGKGKRQHSGESFIKMFLKHDTHHLKQIREKLNPGHS